jgi:nitroimidazol reductase NimA-like FMN-containing flavoprotein (pyridoxamine 5'-phosphate oxidase superfamily)
MAANATLTVPPHVLTYLTEQKTLTLATASTTGVPHAATLTYVSDGVTLYIWTRPEATTAKQIEQNPLVSFAIDEYAPDWRLTKGIQGSGEARVLLNPEEIRRVVGLFEQKFASLSATGGSNLLLPDHARRAPVHRGRERRRGVRPGARLRLPPGPRL